MTNVACENCGVPAGEDCYLLCYNSPGYYSPEQERLDDAHYGEDDHRERYAGEAIGPDDDEGREYDDLDVAEEREAYYRDLDHYDRVRDERRHDEIPF